MTSRLRFSVHSAIRTAVAILVCAQLLPAQPRVRTLNAQSQQQWAAVLAMHDARSVHDTVVLDAALASTVAPLRATAARVIGLNRVVSRYALLRSRILFDTDSAVASDAAFALGLARDSASCEALKRALLRSATGVAAAWALGELGSQCSEFAPLLSALTQPDVRAALVRTAGLWKVFPDTSVGLAFTRATSTNERWSALYAFARARRSYGGQFALAASHDRDASIRELAARLFATTFQPEPLNPSVAATLTRLMHDSAAHVRIAAIRSLATFRTVSREPIVARWPSERDKNVRVTLATALGQVATANDTIWATWWRSDTTHIVRRSLIASAWQAGAIAELEAASSDSLATHSDFRLRIAMLNGAGSRAEPRDYRAITKMLRDADHRVRAAAVGALVDSREKFRDSLDWRAMALTALGDDDVGVRQNALAAFVKSAAARDIPLALDAYRRAERDSTADAQETALAVIVSAWRQDSVAFSDSLRTQLSALPAPNELLLQMTARVVTPLAHWQRSATPSSASSVDYARIVREIVAPALAGKPSFLLVETSRGPIRIMLDGVQTPMTVNHLSALAKRGYFGGMRFHRVVPAFVAQGGDPRGDGSGGPGSTIRDELNRTPYRRGAVGMALSGPDTGGSQFFFTLAQQPHLDGRYTVFARVVAGFAAMDALVQGDDLRTIKVVVR
jgi:cyclophilin family peptidyl-prolyl cis-trans isomerase